MEKIILIGGGGHCKSCIDVIEQEDRFTIAGIVDVPEKQQETVLGYPVIGTDADLAELIKTFPNALITLGQIKSPARRRGLFNDLMQMGARFPVIKSPLAYVSSHAQVAEGTIVMHHALINAGAKVGRNCIINTKALIDEYAEKQPERCLSVASLGALRYLSAMKYATAVIGNSSSGIVEAPSFMIPTINIGDRQKGRVKAESIVDCDPSAASIEAAIHNCISLEFQQLLKNTKNPYEKSGTASEIVSVIVTSDLAGLLKKRFYNIADRI